MISLGEYIKKLDQFQKDLPKMLMAEVMLTAGADIRATVENRIEQTGMKGSGGQFKPYSTTPIWTNQKKDPGRKGSTLPGGYAELRRLNNLQTAFKDFSFTGEMWRNFNIIPGECQLYDDGFKVRFGGMDQRSQDIIDWQSKYEGESIIDMTDKEVQDLAKRVDQIVLRKFKEYGL